MPRLTARPIAPGVLGLAAVALVAQTPATESSHVDAPIAGLWRGHAVCAVPNSACRDEANVCRINEAAGKAGWFHLTGSKIVNGKEIVMGTSDRLSPHRSATGKLAPKFSAPLSASSTRTGSLGLMLDP